MPGLLSALPAAGFVLYVAVAILLVRTYRRTRDVGFVWLGAAVLVWPVAARQLRFLVDRVGAGPFDTVGQFAAVLNMSQQVVSLVLLLVAVLYLGKRKQIDTRPA